MQAPCALPYPERYERALQFYQNWPQDAKQPREDTKLILYGLSCQVSHGPCKDTQPNTWNSVELAKWTAWHGLKDMEAMEAMRLFVKTLEEDEPSWFSFTEKSQASTNGRSAVHALQAIACDDAWRSPWISADKHPVPRFEHSCCLLGNFMFLFGGNCGAIPMPADVQQES
jgi:acyl-CoA-binding protein